MEDKNFMKHFLFFTTLIFFCAGFFFGTALPAGAQLSEEYERQTGAFAGSQGAGIETERDIREVVALIIRGALGVIGILFLGYAIYGGYLIMASGGNEEKVNKGKKTLLTAAIGVAVVLSAYAITLAVARIMMPRAPQDGVQWWTEPDYSDYYNRDPLRGGMGDMVPF